jgi:hypothetical protein
MADAIDSRGGSKSSRNTPAAPLGMMTGTRATTSLPRNQFPLSASIRTSLPAKFRSNVEHESGSVLACYGDVAQPTRLLVGFAARTSTIRLTSSTPGNRNRFLLTYSKR